MGRADVSRLCFRESPRPMTKWNDLCLIILKSLLCIRWTILIEIKRGDCLCEGRPLSCCLQISAPRDDLYLPASAQAALDRACSTISDDPGDLLPKDYPAPRRTICLCSSQQRTYLMRGSYPIRCQPDHRQLPSHQFVHPLASYSVSEPSDTGCLVVISSVARTITHFDISSLF